VYCVVICDFAVLPELPKYIHHIALRDEKSGTLFTNLENIVIIELPKMPLEDDGSKAWPVLQCFRCKTGEEAEMLARAYPAVKEIVTSLREFSLGKELRWRYNSYMKAWRDREAYKAEYFARGIEEGATQEREKWMSEVEEERSKFEAERSKSETLLSKFEAERSKAEEERSRAEALERELERLRQDMSSDKRLGT
jgi:hypothetical protein